MKKLITVLIAIFLTGALFGQYASQGYRYPVQYGMPAPGTVTGGVIYLKGLTSGRVKVMAPDIAGASTLFQFPGNNGTNNYVLKTDGNGVTSWVAPPSTMVYPGAGIPLSVAGTSWGTSITNNSTNWNTAYTDRLKWDGGSTDLVAATGRSSLGGTTIGQAYFTLTNPDAISFNRNNANNTVDALSAANFRTAIGAEPALGNPGVTGYVLSSTDAGVRSWVAQTGGYTNLTSFVDQTNWRVFYSNGSGDVTELALGAANTVLTSNGATTPPTFETVGAITGFTPASGSLTLAGADDVTLTTTAGTNVTLPTSGTLATTDQLDEKLNIADTLQANTLITMNSDTGSVAWPIGGGNGLRGSQPSFLPGARLGGFTNPFPHDTIYIVFGIFHTVQDSGTVTMGFKFFKHATTIPSAASTDMMSGEITLSAATSATTTGTVINLDRKSVV